MPSAAFLETVLGDNWWQRAIVFYFGSSPGEGEALASAIRSMGARTAEERFGAAVAVGLALQACYLVEVNQKVEVLSWVVDTLASTKGDFLRRAPNGERFPLTAFILYYLFGRDAVACSVLADSIKAVRSRLIAGERSEGDAEARESWLIVGLLESGEVDRAEALVAGFKPADSRYLLAIHLGSFLIQHLRVTSKAERAAAKRIGTLVAETVGALRVELVKEVKSELLEIRRGELSVLPAPTDGESP
jgi:hypothetical protein